MGEGESKIIVMQMIQLDLSSRILEYSAMKELVYLPQKTKINDNWKVAQHLKSLLFYI